MATLIVRHLLASADDLPPPSAVFQCHGLGRQGH